MRLYMLTKKTNVDHLIGSKVSKTHTRNKINKLERYRYKSLLINFKFLK